MPASVRNWALNINRDSYAAAQRFWGDLNFGSIAYFAAINHSKINENTYFYYFNKSPSSANQTIGATHGIEIMYLFNSWIPGWPKDNADNVISKQMQTDWTNFAKTGDLSINGWTRFSEDMPIQMNYEVNINQSDSSQLELFKPIYEYLSINGK
jgi:carboxylesterase type B